MSTTSGPRRGGPQRRVTAHEGVNGSNETILIDPAANPVLPRTASIQRSEAEWRQALADKDERFRDLHHRVKNNLQLLSSLLSIEIRNITDPQAARHLRDIQRRMRMVVRVHERLYGERESFDDRIDVSGEIKALCAELAQSLGATGQNVTITVEAERCEISSDKLVPLSLIVSELVTNAIKHAAPASPSDAPTAMLVSLAGDHADGWARLSVSDSGSGLPADFDPTRGRGLGMRLIASFVKQLGGTLDIGNTDEPGRKTRRGACFTILFPSTAEPLASSAGPRTAPS